MPKRPKIYWFFQLFGLLILLNIFTACSSNNNPPTVSEPPPPDEAGGEDVGKDKIEGCLVNFRAVIQLKASANPAGSSGTFEILDGNPFPIPEPIPFEVNGNRLILNSENFPPIFFRPPETAADIKISPREGIRSIGTYDPDTGSIEFPNFTFKLEIVQKGGTETFLPGEKVLPALDFTTGTINASGNFNSIEETGSPLSKEDGSLVLVAGLTLPTSFAPLDPLDTIIGGGALTARLEGIVDQVPEKCGEPGDFFTEGENIKVIIENQTLNNKIDFGTSLVIPKNFGDSVLLDCSEASFREMIGKVVTLKNSGTEERNIRIGQPKELDRDIASPLCGGDTEFIRGTITAAGGAECETFSVGGKSFGSGDCILPANPGASISFPVYYLPYNFQPAPPGEDPVADKGRLTINTGNNETVKIDLVGRAIPDTRDVFAVSKVIDGQISNREIRNDGLLKIAISNEAPLPFTQKMVLKNQGPEVWEDVEISLVDGSKFSLKNISGGTLPAAEGDEKGILEFELVFNPGASALVEDQMIIHLVRAGSVTETNPEGIQAQVKIDLLGTKGIPPIRARWQMQFDFFTALIDHVALSEPIESSDYRQDPEEGPAPIFLNFTDTEFEGIQEVELEVGDVNLLDSSLTAKDRRKILRIFSSRATAGINEGEPGESEICNEPENILQSYRKGDCSYFYFTILEAATGYYDDDTGQLTLPSITLRMQNPYHSDIFGIWPASNPAFNPNNFLDSEMTITFTTQLLDRIELNKEGGIGKLLLVPDPRISSSDLAVQDKRLGRECPEGFLEGAFPALKCYLSSDDKFFQGRPVSLRPESTLQYQFVLVGVTRLPPGDTDPNLPWFLGDNGGSRMYIAIQGRLCPEGSKCEF